MTPGLNPEAPEFFPKFTAKIQDGLKKLGTIIQASNLLPLGASFEKLNYITDFNNITGQLSENVIKQSNKIISAENKTRKLKCNDEEYNIDKLSEANDHFLDSTNKNIDIATLKAKPEDFNTTDRNNGSDRVSSWNASPVVSKVQVTTARFNSPRNIPKPQLQFKDQIDNSNRLWVPQIKYKSNSITPLALKLLYNSDGEAVGYEHPYQHELDVYSPSEEILTASKLPPELPRSIKDTKFTYIQTEKELENLVQHLLSVSEVAVDLEHHHIRSYQGITCLIQISTDEGGDFVIDALAVREHLYMLNSVFTNPKILKVFHGADHDILWLQRDFGVYVVGLFDTYPAAKILNLPHFSLKYLLKRYCNFDANKQYQLTDWRVRPLPDELLEYARADTHYLLYIYRCMRDEILNGSQPARLMLVFEMSKEVCAKTYQKTVLDDNSHLQLYRKSKKNFNTQQMAALKLLFKWRDTQARELDENPGYLLPNHMLLTLSELLPRELEGVNACCNPMSWFIKNNLNKIHRMILSCREMPLEPQLYHTPLSISTILNHQNTCSYLCHDISQYPDFRDDLPSILPGGDVQLSPTHGIGYIPEESFVFNTCTDTSKPIKFMSTLNAEATSFIPPFERYKKYRKLAQVEEIREFKEKEAKMAELEAKGKKMTNNEVPAKEIPSTSVTVVQEKPPTETKERKRKMSTGKAKGKDVNLKPEANTNKQATANTNGVPKEQLKKAYDYGSANYMKFRGGQDKEETTKKRNKNMFKKYKK